MPAGTGVSALSAIQCFDTVGWGIGRTHGGLGLCQLLELDDSEEIELISLNTAKFRFDSFRFIVVVTFNIHLNGVYSQQHTT